MSPVPLTPKQKAVLDFICDFVRTNGYSPSNADICRGMNLSSTATTHKYLQILSKKGYLDSLPHRARGVSVKLQVSAVEIPLLGMVSAGQPIEMNEVVETVELPESMLGHGETFALLVKGESMIDEAIKDGDLVIVEKRAIAHNGEMVIACVGNEEVTLKRFYREGARVRLQPSNAAMTPIIVNGCDVRVIGVVIGILRKYRRY